MIVLLEGPDGCGKTTLAQKLVEKYDGEYHHCGVVKNIFQLHLNTVRRCLTDDRLHIIDRLYVSEYVYGNVYRDGESYDTKGFANAFPHKVIYVCIPTVDYLLHHKLKSEREMFKDKQMEVYDAYANYFKLHTPGYVYDYTEGKELCL
jgi:thymidylate kinase